MTLLYVIKDGFTMVLYAVASTRDDADAEFRQALMTHDFWKLTLCEYYVMADGFLSQARVLREEYMHDEYSTCDESE